MTDSTADKWLKAWRHIGLVASSGWDASIGDVDVAADPAPKAYLYVFDLATRWTWMGAASLAAFHKASAAGGQLDDTGLNAVRGGLGALIAKFARGDGDVKNSEQANDLGLLASMYAGGTAVYQVAKGFPDRCHFVVIVYRKHGSDNVLLRPFAMQLPPDKPASADYFEGMLKQVVQMDKARHPEWFDEIGE